MIMLLSYIKSVDGRSQADSPNHFMVREPFFRVGFDTGKNNPSRLTLVPILL